MSQAQVSMVTSQQESALATELSWGLTCYYLITVAAGQYFLLSVDENTAGVRLSGWTESSVIGSSRFKDLYWNCLILPLRPRAWKAMCGDTLFML